MKWSFMQGGFRAAWDISSFVTKAYQVPEVLKSPHGKFNLYRGALINYVKKGSKRVKTYPSEQYPTQDNEGN